MLPFFALLPIFPYPFSNLDSKIGRINLDMLSSMLYTVTESIYTVTESIYTVTESIYTVTESIYTVTESIYTVTESIYTVTELHLYLYLLLFSLSLQVLYLLILLLPCTLEMLFHFMHYYSQISIVIKLLQKASSTFIFHFCILISHMKNRVFTYIEKHLPIFCQFE